MSFAFDAFHHKIVQAILAADIVKHANVRMIQPGDRFRFALKTLLACRIGTHLLGENLYGHGAAQAFVRGTVDFAHAASAKR